MDKPDVIALLRRKVFMAGSQKNFAEQNGISEQYLGDILLGRREPGKKILKALGLVRVVSYEMTP